MNAAPARRPAMRIRFTSLACAVIAAAAMLAAPLRAHAATYTHLDNTTDLSLSGAWSTGGPVTSADIGAFTGAYATAGSLSGTWSGAASWGGILIGNITGAAAGTVNLGGSGNATVGSNITIGSSGIDMSGANQNLVINSATTTFNLSQTWNIASGRVLRFGTTAAGGGNARVTGTNPNAVITIAGSGTVELNQGGGTGFADATGFANYQGKWQVNSGATLRGFKNGATAFGSNTAADAITLNGGTLVDGNFSVFGNWTWNTNITLAAASNSAIDQQIGGSASNRSLKLMGNFTGSGNLTFKETGSVDAFGSDDLGYIISGTNNTISGTVVIGGTTENGIAGRVSSVRVGGVYGATDTSTVAGNAGTLGTAVVVNNGVLTLSHSDTWTFGNNVSGTGVLRIGSTGIANSSTQIVTLGGSNSYTGGTLVNVGAAIFSSTNARPGTGTVSGSAGAVVGLGVGAAAPYYSSADVDSLFANTLTGFSLATTATVGIDTAAGSFTYATNIGSSVTRGLFKTGSNTLTLSGSNAYTGNTTVVGGTLALTSTNAVPGWNAAGRVTVRTGAGLTVAAFGASDIATLLTNVTFSGTSRLGIDTTSGDVAYSGTITDVATGFGITKLGTGFLTLSASNSYTGGTTLTTGTLRVGNDNALGTGTVALNAGAISSDSATARTLANNLTVGGNVRIGDGTNTGLLVFNGSVDLQGGTRTLDSRLTSALGARFSGVISNGGIEINGASAGIVTLSNNSNSFTGPTTVTSGYLAVTTGAVANSSSMTLAGANTRLFVGETGNTTINNLSGTSSATVRTDFTITGGNGNRVIAVNQTADGTFAGTFVEGGSRPIVLTKNGAATLTLTGAGTYTGATTVNSGTLKIGGAGALGGASYAGNITNNATLHFDSTLTQTLSGSLSGAGAFLKTNSGTVILTGNSDYQGAITVEAGTLQIGNNTSTGFIGNAAMVTNNAALVWYRSTDTNVGTSISGSGTLTKLGGAILSLNDANTYTGVTTITSGTLRVGNNGTTGSLGSGDVVNNAALLFSRSNAITAANVISGSGTLVKEAAGTLTLTGSSTYTGATTITAGTLEIGGAGRLGGGSYAAAIDNSGALAFSTSANQTLSGTISGAGTLAKSGAGTLTLTGPNTYSGATAVTGGTLSVSGDANLGAAPGSATAGQLAISGGVLSVSGGFTLNSNRGIALGPASGAGDGTIHVATGTLVYGGVAADNGSGAGGLAKTGPGGLQLTGVNTYTGPTTISSGTLEIGGSGQLGGGSYAGAISNSTALLFTTSANQTLSGGITGNGTFTKSGAGSLTLQGDNTYSGATTVSGGSLKVNGTLTSSAIAVSGGGIIGGSGTIANVTLNGGVVSPGNSPGNLTVGDMSWDATSSYDWELYDYQGTAGSTTGWDLISGTGTLSVSGTGFAFNLFSMSGTNTRGSLPPERWSQTTSGTFRIANFSSISAPSGTWWTLNTTGFTPLSATLGTFSIAVGSTSIDVIYTHTPPQAYVWLAGSGTWSDGANWNTDPDTPEGTPEIVFSGAGGTSTNDIVTGTLTNQIESVTGLTFSGSASGSYTIDGNAFSLGSIGIVNQSAYQQNLQNDLTLATSSLANAETAGLLLSGTISTLGYGFTVTGSANTTISGVVTGSGGLGKLGAGTLTLTGSNDFTGGTTITGGTVVVGDGATTGVLPGNVINNAALVINRTDDVTMAGSIGGTGSLTKLGGNTFTLTGSNSYSGSTTISGGTLSIGDAGRLGGGSYAGAVDNAGVLSVATTADQTLSGVISGVGSLAKSAAGTLTLTGTSTYTGNTTITSGTLVIGGAGQFGGGAYAGAIDNAGVLSVATTADQTLSGVISGVGVLAKSAAGTLTLTGTSTFTGSTTISSGTLVIGGAGQLGGGSYAGAISNAGALSVATTANQTLSGTVSGAGRLLKSAAGSLTVTAANSYSGGTTLSAGMLLVGNNAALGTGTVTLSGGALSSDGATSRSLANVLSIGGDVTLGNATNSGTLTFSGSASLGGGTRTITTPSDVTFSAIVANGTLTKAGAGTLYLSASNAITAPVTVNGGTLKFGTQYALGVSGSQTQVTQTVVNAGGAVDFNGSAGQYGYTIAGSGPGGAGALVNTGAALGTGLAQTSNIKLAADATIGGSSDWGLIALTYAANTLDLNGFTLTKTGNNTITLAKTTITAGTIVISQGTLSQFNTGATGSSTTITLANTAGATLSLNNLAMTIGALSGGGASGGNVALGNQTLTVGGLGTSTTYSGSIGGTGGLTKVGVGTLTLAGTSAYTGATTLTAGTLAFTSNNFLGSTLASAVSDTTGVVALGGNTVTLGNGNANGFYYGGVNGPGTFALRGGSFTIALSSGAAGTSGNAQFVQTPSLTAFALDTGASATDRKDFAYINDSGAVLLLSSLTGYGAIRMDANGVANATTMRFITVNQATDTQFDGAIVTHKSTGNASRAITFEKQGAGTLTLAGFLGKETASANSGAVPLNIIVNGGGLIITDTDNTQTTNTGAINTSGTITITSGTLGFANLALINAAGSTGVASIRMNGGVLRWNSGNTQDITAGGRLTLVSGSTATFDTNGNNVTLGTALGGGAIASPVTKIGGGTLTLSGANVYTGDTTISGGTLAIGGNGTLGGGSYAGAITNNAAFVVNTSAAQALSGAIGGLGSLTKSGAGALTLTNASNSYAGGTLLTAGSLLVGNDAALGSGTVTLTGGALSSNGGTARSIANALAFGGNATLGDATNDGLLTFNGGVNLGGVTQQLTTPSNVTIASVISNGGLTKAGAGVLTLSASNSFAGGLTVSAGRLQIGNDAALSTGTVTLTGGALSSDGATARTIANVVAVGGDATLGDATNSGLLTFNGGVDLGNVTRQLTTPSNVTIASAVSNGGLTKAGAGTLTLSAANTYAGPTTISAGTLALSGAGDIASGSAALVSIASGATLDISGASGARTIGALADGDGSSQVILGGNTLRSVVGGYSVFGGVITGSGGFTKAGGDTLELTGGQVFTGVTTVEAGKLLLASGIALATSSRIQVAGGATIETYSEQTLTIVNNQTLGGYGTVSGPLAFESGGILSPGGSVGTLFNTGNTTWNGGMHYVFEVNNASGTPGMSPGWDLFSTTGNLLLTVTGSGTDKIFVDLTSLSGSASGQAASFDPNFNYAWQFATAGSQIAYTYGENAGWFQVVTGSFQNITNGSFYVARGDELGAIGVTPTSTDQLYVVYAAVPEPATLALASIGLFVGGLAAARRRRRITEA